MWILKSFGTSGTMKIHMKTVHGKIKSFMCDSCEKSFGLKGNLLRHQKIVHEKVTPYSCESCEKSFCQIWLIFYAGTFYLIQPTVPWLLMKSFEKSDFGSKWLENF